MENPTNHSKAEKRNTSAPMEMWRALLATFPTKTLKKGSIILNPQTVESKVKYLVSGIVREFYVTDKKELNVDFYEAREFITDCVSLHNAIQSKKWQECITDVDIKMIPRAQFDLFLSKHEGVDASFKAAFLTLLGQRETREFSRLTKGPEALYQELLETKPSWIQNIPQYHIASYLNISPETLSRIRRRIS
ncbi:hypothetical protein BKI52_40855 [marine bacterium AO1-C]|nr:hypothetical protein BKI52_40855 [marine bacterium AO1-C]